VIPPEAAARAVSTPCTACGACCARWRVSFYWGEADDAAGGWVPVRWTEPIGPHRRAMRGSSARVPRCEALQGRLGESVACSIYAGRPSPCREFTWHGEGGLPNPRCNEARASIGLAPLPDPG
jgi:Fe-S-cluster containining protein